MDNSNTNPDDNQKEDLISDYVNEIRQSEMEGYKAAVKKARTALFVAAGLIFAGEIVGMAAAGNGFDYMIFLIALVESAVFILLALWTKKRPYSAVVAGLIAFIGIIVLAAVFNGIVFGAEGVLKVVTGGILYKIFILGALIRALGDAKAMQDHKKNAPLE